MTTRPDDAEICDRTLDGDVEAFRIIFRQLSPEVLALCMKILGNTQDAEDIVADVFFELWTNRHRFDPARGTLRSYVLMLARSRSIDLYRSKAKARARVDSQASPIDNAVESTHASLHDLTLREFSGLAKSALEKVTEEERVAIELAFYEGLSHAQIANRLDSPLGTVKSHIRRGLAKLKQKLSVWES